MAEMADNSSDVSYQATNATVAATKHLQGTNVIILLQLVQQWSNYRIHVLTNGASEAQNGVKGNLPSSRQFT